MLIEPLILGRRGNDIATLMSPSQQGWLSFFFGALALVIGSWLRLSSTSGSSFLLLLAPLLLLLLGSCSCLP